MKAPARIAACCILLALTAIPVSYAQSTCPAGTPLVQCFQQPCATQACKDQCKNAVPKGYTLSLQCVDNYCGGCNCDCCLPRNTICAVDGPLNATKCCEGTVCALSNACVSNPFAKCGTVCIPKEEAYDQCKKKGASCKLNKLECCPGTSCRRNTKGKGASCQTCKPLNAKCVPSRKDCCPYLGCKSAGKGKGFTCQPARLG